MASAAGNGATAARKLNEGTSDDSPKTPKPPSGPSSGRPKQRKDASSKMDSAEEQMWTEIFSCIANAGCDTNSEQFRQCVRLAAQLQRNTSELSSECLKAGFVEADLRKAVCENIFRPCPNPQDGASKASEQEIQKEAPEQPEQQPEQQPAAESSRSTGKAKGGTKKKTAKMEEETIPEDEEAKHADLKKRESSSRKSLTDLGPLMRCGTGDYTKKNMEKRRSIMQSRNKGKSVHEHSLFISKHMDGHPSQAYDMGQQVGEGTFGFVRKARHRQTGQIHAVKAVPKDKICSKAMWAEIEVMKQLDHPHIMRLYYTFEDPEHIYMASEMCAGGELYDVIDEAGILTERITSMLLQQILSAVNYLHVRSICHRDLKPENFLVLKRTEPEHLQLKLIDFGTAKRFDAEPMITKVCTAHYVAPEVLKRGDVAYTEKVDVWSCGVMLYMMLCGFMPFHHEAQGELLKLVKKGKYSFKPENVWALISRPAKDLILNMLSVKIDKRYTALQAFQHEWVQSVVENDSDHIAVDEQIVKNMRKFLTNNRLKRVALQIIARQVHDDTVQRLRDIFLGIDEDRSGCLTVGEMKEAICKLDMSKRSHAEMMTIVERVDQDGSGTIEWTEFLAATLTPEQYLREDACRAAFHLMDVDEDGVLSRSDLIKLLGGRGEDLISSAGIVEIEQIMREVDENADGDITFEEFMGLMADDGPRGTDTAVSLRWKRGKKERCSVLADDSEVLQDRNLERSGTTTAVVVEESDEEAAAFGEDESPKGSKKKKKAANTGDECEWRIQSQKAWQFAGESATLTTYEKKDEKLLQFEVLKMASGQKLTATGSQEEFDALCQEQKGSHAEKIDAAIRVLFSDEAGSEPASASGECRSMAPPSGSAPIAAPVADS